MTVSVYYVVLTTPRRHYTVRLSRPAPRRGWGLRAGPRAVLSGARRVRAAQLLQLVPHAQRPSPDDAEGDALEVVLHEAARAARVARRVARAGACGEVGELVEEVLGARLEPAEHLVQEENDAPAAADRVGVPCS